MRRALLLRGAIVSAWAAIDTTMSEVALRASTSEHYSSISSRYPYSAESKAKFLRAVIEREGPMRRFKDTGQALLRQYEDLKDLRHQMAHASMRILPNWGVTFIDYRPTSEGTVTVRRHRYTLDQLNRLARKATRLSRIVQRAKAQIDSDGLLPTLQSD
jgi:hypothetical protein